MKLSIIIPAYNAEKTIVRCVESVVIEPELACEIVIINDGSTDKTLEVCTKLSKKNNNIKVLSQQNKGAAAARNLGIENSSGEYIAFIDADDIVVPNYIKKILGNIEGNSADIFWFNMRCVDEQKHELFATQRCEKRLLTQKEFISTFYGMSIDTGSLCSKIYRRDFIREHNLWINPSIVYGEDWDFNLRLALNGAVVYIVPEIIYNYVKYKTLTTVSSRFYKSDFMSFCKSYLRLVDIAKDYDLDGYLTDQINIFTYNCICQIQKLLSSALNKEEIIEEYYSMASNEVLRDALRGDKWTGKYMSKRQKLVARFIRYNRLKLALVLLKL